MGNLTDVRWSYHAYDGLTICMIVYRVCDGRTSARCSYHVYYGLTMCTIILPCVRWSYMCMMVLPCIYDGLTMCIIVFSMMDTFNTTAWSAFSSGLAFGSTRDIRWSKRRRSPFLRPPANSTGRNNTTYSM